MHLFEKYTETRRNLLPPFWGKDKKLKALILIILSTLNHLLIAVGKLNIMHLFEKCNETRSNLLPPFWGKDWRLGGLILIILSSCNPDNNINREDLVTRHNPVIRHTDPLDVFTVGNGNFAFTVDATGLQSFPVYHEQGIPLGTLSNWGWHSIPSDKTYSLENVSQKFSSCNDSVPYVYRFSKGEKGNASEYLRQNPHRLHLGLIGYLIRKENGEFIQVSDLKDIECKLDMWTGKISSTFSIEGIPVHTEVLVHQENDEIAIHVRSELIAEKRLRIRFRFPYGSGCQFCAGYDFDHPEAHQTVVDGGNQNAIFSRKLDSTFYYVNASWEGPGELNQVARHTYILTPDASSTNFSMNVSFSPAVPASANHSFAATEDNNIVAWKQFWESGAAIDFSGSTDPRADELERRIILSQYLTRIQSSGTMPPQETGLTMNSWYGIFHLEMHWWHGVHFALWNRPELFFNSMDWYREIMPLARKTAEWQGYEGVRWPKMPDPSGIENPSTVAPFLIWQQPHPIYYAELLYHLHPSDSILNYFKEIVFETSDFMASFTHFNEVTRQYDLCPPLIPAQEVFDLHTTYNPSFELSYWQYGLSMAQEWKKRLGLPVDANWQDVIDHLAPLPVKDSLYLPHAHCTDGNVDPAYRRDHPIVLGIMGFLPETSRVSREIMNNTLDAVLSDWNWESTWGWDYPLAAMAAARLERPEDAVNLLLMDTQKNTYLLNGHNYQNARLPVYLPGNGGLLTAVALMAAGWENAPGRPAPGFPDNGKWKVRTENFPVFR